MSYQRLTSQEIENLRAEMRAAGHWMKAELARRRQRYKKIGAVETSNDPITNDKAS
ncbi:hypothetical protein [Kushneria konosiri]|uniref:hypothetical protein n=1 Tax=Kushneria konosiri TaxID=698828 RepID=UPI001314D526|nr:hypothetical protein [Kushneria konosiri]